MLADCGRFVRLLIKVPLELSDSSYVRNVRHVDNGNFMTQSCENAIICNRKKQDLRPDDEERETREEFVLLPWEADPHFQEDARYQSFRNRRLAEDVSMIRQEIMDDTTIIPDEKVDLIVELEMCHTENLQLCFKKIETKSRRKKRIIGRRETFG